MQENGYRARRSRVSGGEMPSQEAMRTSGAALGVKHKDSQAQEKLSPEEP